MRLPSAATAVWTGNTRRPAIAVRGSSEHARPEGPGVTEGLPAAPDSPPDQPRAAPPRYPSNLKVVKLNVDDQPQIAARYQVQGIPLLVLVRDGREVDRLVGAVPERDIDAWLRRHVDVSAGTPA